MSDDKDRGEGNAPIKIVVNGECKSLPSMWGEMDEMLTKGGAGIEQRFSMKSAFFAGAAAIIGGMLGYNKLDHDRNIIDLDVLAQAKRDLRTYSKESEAEAQRLSGKEPTWATEDMKRPFGKWGNA